MSRASVASARTEARARRERTFFKLPTSDLRKCRQRRISRLYVRRALTSSLSLYISPTGERCIFIVSFAFKNSSTSHADSLTYQGSRRGFKTVPRVHSPTLKVFHVCIQSYCMRMMALLRKANGANYARRFTHRNLFLIIWARSHKLRGPKFCIAKYSLCFLLAIELCQ